MLKRLRKISLFFLFYFFISAKFALYAFSQVNDTVISYTETDVQIDSGYLAIHGSVIIPDGTEKTPVVLIISGSGPTDRNGNNPFGLATDSYKLLAAGLAQKKIASLRYDKRGIAKSQPALESENLLSFGQYVEDAEKWVKWLRKDKRFSKIFILGHSEGALIGTLTANFQNPDGFISISGSAVTADSMIIEQISKQSPALGDTARKIINHIKKGEPFQVNRNLEALLRPGVTGYLRSWFSLSPVTELSLVRCPILVVQGTTDIQVSENEAKKLSKVRPGTRLAIIENMNHVLKTSSADSAENLATYRDKTFPLAPALVPVISDFIFSIK